MDLSKNTPHLGHPWQISSIFIVKKTYKSRDADKETKNMDQIGIDEDILNCFLEPPDPCLNIYLHPS